MKKLKSLFGRKQDDKSSFVRNLGWLGLSGGVNRVTRLVTTIILARFLTQYDYGLVAMILATNEFVKVFTRNGVAVKLIQAKEEELEGLAQSAYWLNWIMFTGLFFIQCLAGFAIAQIYQAPELVLPICAMGFGLLLLPHGLVQASLLKRENRFQIIALVQVLQISSDNILSLIFAIAGFGLWAVVLPKIIVAPIWVTMMLKNHKWRPKWQFNNQHWGELIRFGRSVLGVELLKTLRNNLDYLIVGKFLSIEALGIYYFAFNAGLGISVGITTSIRAAILPHLCNARDNLVEFKSRYYKSMKTIALIIVPMVLLQSLLAPIYVPIVFGQKWIPAIPILIMICLSAIPRPFADSASQLLVAVNKPDIDLKWNLVFTFLFTAALLVGVKWQSLGVAIAVLATHCILMPLFTIWVSKYVFQRAALSSNN